MDKVIQISKALGDPNRVRALCALREGELCLCHLIELLGLVPSTVSKHMSILKAAKLVLARKEGKWMHYSLNTIDIRIKEILNWVFSGLTNDPVISTDKKNIGHISCKP